MSRVYHSGVALTGGRPGARSLIAKLGGEPVADGLHITLLCKEGL